MVGRVSRPTPEPWTEPDPVLVKVASTLNPGSVLDVGCGGGHDALWLARHGWSVTAIDMSRHVISRLRKRLKEAQLDVTPLVADVTTLEATSEFDLVSICYMHLPSTDRCKMLGTSSSLVKPGGTLLFRSFDRSLDEAPFDPSLLPSREDVLAELDAGLQIRRADVADEFFPYMKKQMTLLTVVASRRE